MENVDSVIRGLEPKGPDSIPGYDQSQAEAYETLRTNGLCTKDMEANLAHMAVIDAEVELEFTENKDIRKEIMKVIRKELIPEATKHCFKCPVINVCTDYSLDLKRLDGGVFGGMPGTVRKIIAGEAKTPQVKYPRIRDAHAFSKAG